ncbi:hypothetical protein RHGRI_007822 [Rhododendron griersonianum]|uniref:Uncharacterized protein n=1 Tax=Rhododendron griersonianum TaxID=479676 RepID=A0AAV6KXZ6_9ERIC|nr:hypothetical protein RHGRI_007822 [Rhododendron griersonianum]
MGMSSSLLKFIKFITSSQPLLPTMVLLEPATCGSSQLSQPWEHLRSCRKLIQRAGFQIPNSGPATEGLRGILCSAACRLLSELLSEADCLLPLIFIKECSPAVLLYSAAVPCGTALTMGFLKLLRSEQLAAVLVAAMVLHVATSVASVGCSNVSCYPVAVLVAALLQCCFQVFRRAAVQFCYCPVMAGCCYGSATSNSKLLSSCSFKAFMRPISQDQVQIQTVPLRSPV